MGQALYRQYRPKSLKDVVGQDHITETLSRAVSSDNISHAYLFTGPRGVGKTSIARIMAHEINKTPYVDDSSDIDIIEIDAASNGRVDEIRELREKAYTSPAISKYKIYIIDEVHMLSAGAFNALLKILEEPPSHVIFILATTESHKLPATIISRTQRFPFKAINPEVMSKTLEHIAKKEDIKITKKALDLIAIQAAGSLRDGTSILDQVRNFSSKSDQITEDDVSSIIGVPPKQAITDLISYIFLGSEIKDIVLALGNLSEAGYQPAKIAKELITEVRQELIHGSKNLQMKSSIELMTDLINVSSSANPEGYLEIILIKHSTPKLKAKNNDSNNEPANLEIAEPASKAPLRKEPAKIINDKTLSKAGENKKSDEVEAIKSDGNKGSTLALNMTVWNEVINELKKKYNTLYGIIKMAVPKFDTPGQVDLVFQFDFHKKKLMEAGNSKKLTDIIYELTRQSVAIVCTVDKSIKPVYSEDEPINPSSQKKEIGTINSIFDGAEVLES